MNPRVNGVHSTSDADLAATSTQQDDVVRAQLFLRDYAKNYQTAQGLNRAASSALHILPEMVMRLVIKHHRAYRDNCSAKVYYKIYRDCLRRHKLTRQALLQKLLADKQKINDLLGLTNIKPSLSDLSDLAAQTAPLNQATSSTATASTSQPASAVKRKNVTFQEEDPNKKNKVTLADWSASDKAIVANLEQEFKDFCADNESQARLLSIIMKNPILRGYENFEEDELQKLRAFISRNSNANDLLQLQGVEKKHVDNALAEERAVEAKITEADNALQQLHSKLYNYLMSDKDVVAVRRIKSALSVEQKAAFMAYADNSVSDPNQSVTDVCNAYQNRQVKIAALERELAAEIQTSQTLMQELTNANDRFEAFITVHDDLEILDPAASTITLSN